MEQPDSSRKDTTEVRRLDPCLDVTVQLISGRDNHPLQYRKLYGALMEAAINKRMHFFYESHKDYKSCETGAVTSITPISDNIYYITTENKSAYRIMLHAKALEEPLDTRKTLPKQHHTMS